MQVDPLCPGVLDTISVEFFHKKFRSRQTEPVDTLFHIAHHKYIIFSLTYRRNAGQDCLLNQIAVLIFIDHNLQELLLILLRYRRRQKVILRFLCQDLKRVLFHIRKIYHILGPLLLFKPHGKSSYQLRNLLYHRPASLDIQQHLLRLFIEILGDQVFDHPLYIFPYRLYLSRLFFRDRFIPVGCKPHPGNVPHTFPEACKTVLLLKFFYDPQICLQNLLVNCGSVCLTADSDSPGKKPACILEIPPYIFLDISGIFTAFQFLKGFCAVSVHTGRQPPLRSRIAPGILVDLKNQFFNLLIRPAGSICGHKVQEPSSSLLITFFQHFPQHIMAQEL